MKYLISLFVAVLIYSSDFAQSPQSPYIERLYLNLSRCPNEDTLRVLALDSLADYYGFIQSDSCIFYATKLTALSEKLNYEHGKYLGFKSLFFAFNCQGNYPAAFEQTQNMKKLSEQMTKEKAITLASSYYFSGLISRQMKDYPNAIFELQASNILWNSANFPIQEHFYSYSQLGILYASLSRFDSAIWYAQKGFDLSLKAIEYAKYRALAYGAIGNIQVVLHNFPLAEKYFREGIVEAGNYDNIYFQARNYNNLARLFDIQNKKDSCIYYAKISQQICQQHKFSDYNFEASSLLTKTYESENNTDSTLKYMKIMLAAKDSVFSQSKIQQYQQFAFSEIQRQQDIIAGRERFRGQVRFYGVLAAAIVLLLLIFIFYRNNKQMRFAKLKTERAFERLKSTQALLVQSEKMASLGELTAGIAHEIQNPLNFVNNFSEVNSELIVEMNDEIDKGNIEQARTIANEIKENELKITHHGKRADAIVKGMLQHSRTSTGQKVPTDINELADEYLRLSYHGLRAKEKNFNSAIRTDFDSTIEKIDIIPQDIGRVLLNLYNNAFYAVGEKMKTNPLGYEPLVMVSTKKTGDKIEIVIRDNGNGIPPNILEKIFQPFFTTKPTGQGTGLGLSMSYDIIKAHLGEIMVNTKEGEFTEFTIKM